MNYDSIWARCQEQYKKIYDFMQGADVSLKTIRTNVSTQTANYKKMDKRISRIEAKLKILDLDIPESSKTDLKEGE